CPPPPPRAPRIRAPPAGGRRGPALNPGAPRPRLALDDADLQPRRREAPAPRLRPRAPALVTLGRRNEASPPELLPAAATTHRLVKISDPDAERFLLLLAAQRSPRTVDAYRRDL